MMASLLVAMLVVSLTTNIFPLFNVVAILCLFPLRIFWTKIVTPDRWLGPRTAVRFLLVAYAFWILSYLLTTAPLSGLFSYNFLSQGGALIVGYLPLLLLRDIGLNSRFVYRLVWVYLGMLAGSTVVGAILIVMLGLDHRLVAEVPVLKAFLQIVPGREMPVMFLGPYRTHMTTGNQYAIAALVALCFSFGERNPRVNSWTNLAFVCLLGGMILSGARTAYVAFAGAFMFLFVKTNSKRRHFKPLAKVAALVLVPVLVFAISNGSVLGRAASIMHFEHDPHMIGRFALYEEALGNFASSPLIGIGFGRYGESGKTYFGIRHLVYVATEGNPVDAYPAHNSYLQFLAEGGLVGLFLMLGVWVSTYRWAGQLRRTFPEGSMAATLCHGVQAAALVTFLSSFSGTSMMMASTPLTVFTLVGLLRNLACSECKAQVASSISVVRLLGQQVQAQPLRPATG